MERDRGSVIMWMLCVLVLATALVLAVVHESTAAAEDGRAQTVADLAALAGAGGDRADADAVAVENGSVVVDFSAEDGTVAVVVRRHGVTASAHASLGGPRLAGTSP